MTEKNEHEDYLDQSDEYSDELSVKSSQSYVQNIPDEEETSRRTPSSLNNYSILPPIRSAMKDENSKQQQHFLRQLQEKYHTNDPNYDKNSAELGTDAKLDDAYLKMKRLDKALEEAFEKEKQVKLETMSLMKKLRSEMQSMAVTLNDDANTNSHTQSNFKRFLALDDEILKLDGNSIENETSHQGESIFKTQLSDPLGDSNSSHKTEKGSASSSSKMPPLNRKKKSSFSSNSSTTTNSRTKVPKGKTPEKDFIKRNIQLAKELGGTWALTDEERQRLNELMKEDEQENAVALPNQALNGYIPSMTEAERLKEIDDLLEKEYYNPLLNHQLRRNNEPDVDYGNLQQITNEENEMMENHFGERVLRETRLQREHKQRLKLIDEKLERLHHPPTEEKVEAILSDDQLNELLGQCAIDEMKQHYSFLNRNDSNQVEIDFNHLSNYALTHYAENHQGPLITDDIIQLLISEAEQEGIAMRKFAPDDDEEFHSIEHHQTAPRLSIAPAHDRPMSTTSISSLLETD